MRQSIQNSKQQVELYSHPNPIKKVLVSLLGFGIRKFGSLIIAVKPSLDTDVFIIDDGGGSYAVLVVPEQPTKM